MMNKTDIVNKVAAKSGMTKKASKEMIEYVLESIVEGVVEDGEVRLMGFGTFSLKEREAREGRNPQTGEAMMMPATKRMAFKCSSTVKGQLND